MLGGGGYARSRSHLPPIRPNGTSSSRAQEHSTTAAPYASRISVSAGDTGILPFGLNDMSVNRVYDPGRRGGKPT